MLPVIVSCIVAGARQSAISQLFSLSPTSSPELFP